MIDFLKFLYKLLSEFFDEINDEINDLINDLINYIINEYFIYIYIYFFRVFINCFDDIIVLNLPYFFDPIFFNFSFGNDDLTIIFFRLICFIFAFVYVFYPEKIRNIRQFIHAIKFAFNGLYENRSRTGIFILLLYIDFFKEWFYILLLYFVY